jgi:hypothetical protein
MSHSGESPMPWRPVRADTANMTPVAERYDTRRSRFARAGGDESPGRDVLRTGHHDGMDTARRIELQKLSERIARNAYEVDPHRVADAIVARLLAGNGASELSDRLRGQCS